MESLFLALLLLAAVLISSIVDQFTSEAVSLPLIQIAVGIVIALFATQGVNITLDPELFLVLFIAPLLYADAQETDKATLLKNIRPVLLLAIGLVVATTLVIGFALNALEPSIPLAAAFALGAALGPTDAVAVSSLGKRVNIPDRQSNWLRGELLLNDASGIVSFQFAVAAVTTGTFSVLEATSKFGIEFLGGIAVGLALGFLGRFIVTKARDSGVDNTTFHVLFELFTPFIVYLVADSIHVSGIIAVVVTGLMDVAKPQAIGPSISRLNIVSSSVWRVLTFALNGIVFVLLGTQLPRAFQTTWNDVGISNEMLVAYVFALTAILIAVRLIWCLLMEVGYRKKHKDELFPFSATRAALITAIAGAKGTVTLAVMFTLPFYISTSPELVAFPHRDLLIFLSCGVIVLTLLLSQFLMPVIAPKPKKIPEEQLERETEAILGVMRTTVENLAAHQNDENRAATQVVLNSYNERIERIKSGRDVEDEPNVELRLKAIGWEIEYVEELLSKGQADPDAANLYLNRLEKAEELLERSQFLHKLHRYRSRFLRIIKKLAHLFAKKMPVINPSETAQVYRNLQLTCARYMEEKLKDAMSDPSIPAEDANKLMLEYQKVANTLGMRTEAMISITPNTARPEDIDEVKRAGYMYEIEAIQQLYEDGVMTRATARRLRNNVNLMLMDLLETV